MSANGGAPGEGTATPAARGLVRRFPKTTLVVVNLLGIAVLLGIGELAARLLRPDWAPAHAERARF